jgi:hypothetical protein
MGTPLRATSAVLACALVAALVAPAALADASRASRERDFTPAPGPRPTEAETSIADPELRALPNGRIAWRARDTTRIPSIGAPSQTMGFDAIPRIGGNWPADPTVAICDSAFVTAVNTSFAVYDRAGVSLLGPDPLRPLFPLPNGTQVFDPKVVYDQYRDRFVVAFLAVNDARRKSWILIIAIPDATAHDISTWCGAQIEGDRTTGDGKQFADYPGLGYDRDHVAVTTNQFDFGTEAYRGAQLISMRKSRLYDCQRTLTVETFAGTDTRNPDGSLAFTIQPATTSGSGHHLYLMSFQDGRPNFVVLWRLRETDHGLALQNTALKVGPVSIGPYGTQGGGSLRAPNTWWDPGDLRMTNAFADLSDARVYGAHVVAKDLRPDPVTDGYLEAVIRWYEVRVKPQLRRATISRTGTIGAPEADVGWPAIGTDVDGNVFVTYSRASTPLEEFLSAWVARIAPGRTASASVLLAAGSARMEAVPGPERWGDYSAISRDPIDPSLVAVVNQYAREDGAGATLDWQQTVHVIGEL